ncbi:carbamoyl-phosphate synthase large subunit [Trueperella bialowiezensis]|uniref:Carbamoyl phosphate synthase large chain n=1 Tax=Trueperella bialowiezensis TaxID=312285 RepID=A0A3S4VEK1_9ACTO|nr:carbamoyl-phosphate synthase large subunit [Trueperella bialowiezensis]VEI12448.1 Carbamoyl-phosphate synthase large chain [Trueperella bialowiezensis]
MPRRTDIESILVIGSGPIVIGQACEFDYSGTQACRVLKDEGYRVVLVNSNPATIMTDPGLADATYIEPITPDVVASIIERERPDAVLATLGGQTALNTAMALHDNGTFAKFGVEFLGADAQAIRKGEDREAFKKVVEACGGESARSHIAHSLDECFAAAEDLRYPLVVRPSFTMGGLGSGLAYNPEQLERIVGGGLHHSHTAEVLMEESILGWKELEFEVIRDSDDVGILVCSIENVDPVGVHTGDSITVAPALTLSDDELARARELSMAIVREVGLAAGGCNIQLAIEPDTGRMVVIEMNPRVSRSSALASKATGVPIAKITTKLAVGYTLAEITNDATGEPLASGDPEIDYVVVKVPRFTFEKFPAADPTLTTTMKSVGEAMALGRNFTEALQKAMRSIDKKGATFHWQGTPNLTELMDSIGTPTENRLVQVQQALRAGASVDEVCAATDITPLFVEAIATINEVADEIATAPALSVDVLTRAKNHGFSDQQIAQLRGIGEATVREVRWAYGLHPVYKKVDTYAGAEGAESNYFYSSYAAQTEVAPRTRPAVIILGSGPNRIGQGIEFDYSCVQATFALAGDYDTVMINCNPETVSTDSDISDRLYFEPLTLEDVLEVYRAEAAAGPIAGVIVQLGGQTPLSPAKDLEAAGVPIVGTSPEAIDLAEDRALFGSVLAKAGLQAPEYGTAVSDAQAIEVAESIGYPVLVRPSYVLGGRGMQIVFSREELLDYLARQESDHTDAVRQSAPLLIDRFLDDAIEIDVDALFDGEELFLGGVMQHIEEAGIHSGDSACVLPPLTMSQTMINKICAATEAIARGVGVVGLINIQFAIRSGTLYVIEANPRASRTVPFVSKATGISLAPAATRIMMGESIADLKACGALPADDARLLDLDGPIAVKEAVLPFQRFATNSGQVVDSVLGPEMRSTGEVMGIDTTFPVAFAKAQAGAYGGLPTSGSVFLSVSDADKAGIIFPAQQLVDMGFTVFATAGTCRVLARYGIEATRVEKIADSPEHNVVHLIESGKIDMVVNTPNNKGSRADGYAIRAATVAADLPIMTTIAEFGAAVQAIKDQRKKDFSVRTIQEYYRGK